MKSIKRECSINFEEKKSKFIGYAKPILNKIDAENFILQIKNLNRDATHNCSVYRVIDNGQEYFKWDDDGEPSGTAGKAMGDVITYTEVYNIVVVATRHFGGIKLGANGLIRNYAKTAKLAIVEGEIVDYIEKKSYILEFPYNKIDDIDNLLKNENVEFLEKGYNEKISYKVRIVAELYDKLKMMNDLLIVEVE
ncbi:MAG: IMPACT family protein [Fusobacteriaceae bacterium]|jgi:uncharacterized YigZ family protein|nr:IMPACT family protein [Fusobacteriaceae bacterium]